MTANVVQTASGAVEGLSEDGSLVFRGIPFAAPPFRERLFQLPQPPQPWEGVRACAEYGPVCPQPEIQLQAMSMDAEVQGEDCLRLNVWTPTTDVGAKLPVMVWIHGGAYLFGSGSAPGNQGHTFSRDGVVFVSFNYRLGAIGFLHTAAVRPDRMAGSGNYGIADQVAALQWVQDNIAAFGGDPDERHGLRSFCRRQLRAVDRGVPAGAAGCSTARSARVPAERRSGASPPHVGAAIAEVYFDLLGKGAPADVDLASLEPAQLLETQAELLDGVRMGKYDDRFGDLTVPFYPVSGTDHQPLSVNDARRGGRHGARRHDHRELSSRDHAVQGDGGVRRPSCRVTSRVREARGGRSVRATYRATEPDASDERIEWSVEGDRGFRIPNLRAIEGRVSNGGRTWVYEFAWESPVFDGRLGAAHGLDVPFVFDDTSTGIGEMLLGGASPEGLASTMHEAWLNFARTGVPSAPGLPEWPTYDFETRATAVFDAETRVELDRDSERRVAWDGADIQHRFPAG